MFVTSKLILPDLKAMKRLLASLLKRETVLLNFYKVDGLILLDRFFLILLNIHGGACELEAEPKILDGDWIIS